MRILTVGPSLVDKIVYTQAVNNIIGFGKNKKVFDTFHNVEITDEGIEFDCEFHIGDVRDVSLRWEYLPVKSIRFLVDIDGMNNIDFQNIKTIDKSIHNLFSEYETKLTKELNDLIGYGYEEFQTMIWYNGYYDDIRKWKMLSIENGQIKCPEYYGLDVKDGVTMPEVVASADYGAMQFIWGSGSAKFGSYGTSPRFGWIDIDKHPEWYDWVDAICMLDEIAFTHLNTYKEYDEFRKVVKEWNRSG